MPASANWPERTLIIPILTVPCACADETPMTSARAQPSLRCIRCISILPGVVRLCWQNCTHENLRGRESSARPIVGVAPPSTLTMHAPSRKDTREGANELGRGSGGYLDHAG